MPSQSVERGDLLHGRDEPAESPGVRIPPPLIFVVPLLMGVGLRRVFPGVPLPRLVRWSLGIPLMSLGGGFIAWFFRTMLQANTAIDPRKPATTLVTDGPFQVSRNPGYLGMATTYAGLALVLDAVSALLALPVVLWVVSHVVIEREESYLEQRFGDEYREYQARVRRWL
jgi:protein-S-isoprenylcysteine O-methyltransferase Ste14